MGQFYILEKLKDDASNKLKVYHTLLTLSSEPKNILAHHKPKKLNSLNQMRNHLLMMKKNSQNSMESVILSINSSAMMKNRSPQVKNHTMLLSPPTKVKTTKK
jgi:hypothetical protein